MNNDQQKTTTVKTHHFNVDDAIKHGVEAAVLLYNLRFWLDKNKANEKHIHEGRVWTYNSASAFKVLFPYMSEPQIRRKLKKLEEDGAIKVGNFNFNRYDQTRWYTVCENEYSMLQNCKMEVTKFQNGSNKNEKSIYDTDIKTTYKKHIVNESAIAERKLLFLNELNTIKGIYDPTTISAFFDYWTEPNRQKTKMRFEMEKTWDTALRLKTWHKRQKDFAPKNSGYAKPEVFTRPKREIVY